MHNDQLEIAQEYLSWLKITKQDITVDTFNSFLRMSSVDVAKDIENSAFIIAISMKM